MLNLSFTACSFHIKEYNGHNKILSLNQKISRLKKDGTTKEFDSTLDLILDFLNNFSLPQTDIEKKKTFECDKDSIITADFDRFRYICVLIKSGNYGNVSNIKDITTGELRYKKGKNETDEKPFYLLIVFPKDSNSVDVQKGMFFFQNVGQYGIKTITTEYMQKYFSNEYKLSLICKTVSTNIFLDKILTQDKIKKMVLVRNNKSDDDADNINYGYGQECRTLGKLSFKEDKWTKIFKSVKHCSKGKNYVFEFENNSYDNAKFIVEIGGRIRTIDLHNIENLSVIEALPDTIINEDGHADGTLFVNYLVKEVVEYYLSQMVLQIS